MPIRLPYLWLSLLLLTGCANNSLMTPYPLRAGSYTHALGLGVLAPAVADARRITAGRDQLLARLEEGRLTQLQGDADASRRAFAEADALIRRQEDKALISASRTANQGLSLVSNDNALPYRSPLYEQILMHSYQALNYLSLRDRDGALVEIRQAQALQDRQREHQGDDPAADELPEGALARYRQDLAPLDELANRTTSAVENPWALYLAGVLYEAGQHWDDAWIDYRRALALVPGHPVVQQDLARLAVRLNRLDEPGLPKPLKAPPPPGPDEGQVVVLFEEGLTPPKQELYLPFPWPEAWYVLAIPYYPQPWQAPTPLKLETAALKSAVFTRPLADLQALAARELRERMPGILLRQTLRAEAKHRLQQEGRDKGGELLGLVIGAWNLVSEQADLRGWLTLPRFAHVARFTLPAGEHEIRLNGAASVMLSVNRRRLTLLRVAQVDNQYYATAWPL
jgi:hypothetical protein